MTSPRPPPSRSPLVIASAGIIGGLLLGYFLGRATHSETMPVPASTVILQMQSAAHSGVGSATNSASAAGGREEAARAEDAPSAAFEGPRDPIAHLRTITKAGTQFGRIIRAFAITSQLSAEDIPAVLAYAQTLTGEERDVISIGALARWAEFDPAAAAEWTRANRAGRGGRAETLGLVCKLSEATGEQRQDEQSPCK